MTEHESEDIAPGGAERHANPEFARALRHGQRHHAVKSDAGENESKGGE